MLPALRHTQLVRRQFDSGPLARCRGRCSWHRLQRCSPAPLRRLWVAHASAWCLAAAVASTYWNAGPIRRRLLGSPGTKWLPLAIHAGRGAAAGCCYYRWAAPAAVRTALVTKRPAASTPPWQTGAARLLTEAQARSAAAAPARCGGLTGLEFQIRLSSDKTYRAASGFSCTTLQLHQAPAAPEGGGTRGAPASLGRRHPQLAAN